jgi:hypothetical protein
MLGKRFGWSWIIPVCCLTLVSACDRFHTPKQQDSSAQPAAGQTQAVATTSSTPAPPAQPEEYHSVDLSLSANGNINLENGVTFGEVTEFTLAYPGGSVPIELESKRIANSEIRTKHFGIIKMHITGIGGADYLMQDSHLAALKNALQEYENANPRTKHTL